MISVEKQPDTSDYAIRASEPYHARRTSCRAPSPLGKSARSKWNKTRFMVMTPRLAKKTGSESRSMPRTPHGIQHLSLASIDFRQQADKIRSSTCVPYSNTETQFVIHETRVVVPYSSCKRWYRLLTSCWGLWPLAGYNIRSLALRIVRSSFSAPVPEATAFPPVPAAAHDFLPSLDSIAGYISRTSGLSRIFLSVFRESNHHY